MPTQTEKGLQVLKVGVPFNNISTYYIETIYQLQCNVSWMGVSNGGMFSVGQLEVVVADRHLTDSWRIFR